MSLRASLVLTMLLAAPPAHAQEGPIRERRVGVHWEAGVPHVDFSALDLGDRAVRRRLSSGLPQVLVMRVYAYRPGASQPIAVAPHSCRVTYDLWEEVYRVEYQDAHVDRTESHADVGAVLRRCLTARRTPIGRRSDYGAATGSVYFAVLIELNPLSPDTVHRMRRWLARPAGGGRIGGEAFFGSFVSLFVNRRIGSAERTLRFRSQDVRVEP